MKCAKLLLEEAGARLEDIVKITIYITDRAYREAVYARARTCATGIPDGDRHRRRV